MASYRATSGGEERVIEAESAAMAACQMARWRWPGDDRPFQAVPVRSEGADVTYAITVLGSSAPPYGHVVVGSA